MGLEPWIRRISQRPATHLPKMLAPSVHFLHNEGVR